MPEYIAERWAAMHMEANAFAELPKNDWNSWRIKN